MVQKVSPPILHRKKHPSVTGVRASQLPAMKNSSLPTGKMPGAASGLPAGAGLQLAESALGVVSDLIHYAETRQQTQQILAQCQRDMRLSDNDLAQAKVELKKLKVSLRADSDKHEREFQDLKDKRQKESEDFDRKFTAVERCLDEYARTGDNQYLAVLSSLLDSLSNGSGTP